MNIYGYARVSTLEQNLDRQLEQLKAYGCEKIFQDKITGATTERPALTELFDILQPGDTIIITDMTRFSRSTKDLFALVEEIQERGCYLKSIKDTWLDITSDNPYSHFLLTVMAAVSQLERDLIKMRQKEGIELAKKKGVYKGRPKTYTENNPRLKHALDLYESGQASTKEAWRATGISEATFYRGLRARRAAEKIK